MSKIGHTVAVIPARGGSKGVPRKNIKLMAGKPLIAYSIEAAKRSALIDRVLVSTDDAEIADVANQYGAEVPFIRPPELASDSAPEWLTWQHAIREIRSVQPLDIFICISPTSPLRAVEDIDNCLNLLASSDADVVCTVRHAERSPYFNMLSMDAEGRARLVIPPASGAIHRRQDAPAVYDMTTVAYAARPDFILKATSMFEGRLRAVLVPADRALDIDTELDFQFGEFMLQRGTKT